MKSNYTIKIRAILISGLIAMGLLLIIHAFRFGINIWDADHQDWGLFGDFFGGTLGAVLSFLTIYLIYVNIHDDKREREKNNEASEFFTILNNHRDLFNKIVVHEFRIHGNQSSWYPVTGPEAIRSILSSQLDGILRNVIFSESDWDFAKIVEELSPPLKIAVVKEFEKQRDANGRPLVFQQDSDIENYLRRIKENQSAPYGIDDFFMRIEPADEFRAILVDQFDFEKNKYILKTAFSSFYDTRGFVFAHYIRNHFYLLKQIDDMKYHNENERKEFSRIARSYLSSPELILLFYNAFSDKIKSPYSSKLAFHEIFDDLHGLPFMYRRFYLKNFHKIRDHLLSL